MSIQHFVFSFVIVCAGFYTYSLHTGGLKMNDNVLCFRLPLIVQEKIYSLAIYNDCVYNYVSVDFFKKQ